MKKDKEPSGLFQQNIQFQVNNSLMTDEQKLVSLGRKYRTKQSMKLRLESQLKYLKPYIVDLMRKIHEDRFDFSRTKILLKRKRSLPSGEKGFRIAKSLADEFGAALYKELVMEKVLEGSPIEMSIQDLLENFEKEDILNFIAEGRITFPAGVVKISPKDMIVRKIRQNVLAEKEKNPKFKKKFYKIMDPEGPKLEIGPIPKSQRKKI